MSLPRPTLKAAIAALALFLAPISASHAASQAAVEKQFHSWIESDIWPAAQAQGISRKAFDRAFAGVALNWKLPDLVAPGEKPKKKKKQTQAEFATPGPYFSEKRLASLASQGKAYASSHARLLKNIERKYGVPGEIVVAIWGRETGYGKAKITSSEMDVLATMAFMGDRKDLFRKELLAALQMVESGIDPKAMKGSWAGAIGQPQFMPSSYLKYAVDFDGDGRKDIWNSVPDALGSIANYLVAKGWQRDRGWGYEVMIPDTVSCAQEGPDLAQPLKKWATLGITRISGKAFPGNEMKADSMMLVPAGRHGPEFIVSPNFYVIKEYNNSDLYALFIGNLADRIANGTGPFKASWGQVGHMLRSDVLHMQQRLNKMGHDVGKIDGLPGYKTRRSIGRWQQQNGIKPTCYPDEALLSKI
ncbi:lytic murein transglycosylase [Rhizobium sp. KVB221]|uniref:Lytic murein transglycosylase n=1 Tax=Rhizobium setariae TaxID=2801340 RepID=A0A936YHU5_9HYPH|nr:lytic murein transglycosylase [Rhizobium setariae]MBL0370499.1 lytic murein transglycosylase [Rhizobium setariae]